MLHWCGRENDVLEIKPSDLRPSEIGQGVNGLLRDLGANVARNERVGPKGRLIVLKHACSTTTQNVNALVEEHNCVEVQPTLYKGGLEWYRILAFNNKDLVGLITALSKGADVNMTSKRTLTDGWARDTITMSIRGLLGKLTDKQLTALMEAMKAGYYETPRKVRTLDISRRVKSPRTTYETHLRKAERKVMNALLPYIELVALQTQTTSA